MADARREPGLRRAIAVSAAIHAAFVGSLLVGSWVTGPEPSLADPAYTVRIVDPSALGGRLPAPESEEAPPPEPDEAAPPPDEPSESAKPPEPPAEDAIPVADRDVETPTPVATAAPTATSAPTARPTKKPTPQPPPTKRPTAKPKPKPEPTATRAPSRAEREVAERDRRLRETMERIRKQTDRGNDAETGAAPGSGGDGGGGGRLTGIDFVIYKNRVESTIQSNWTWMGTNPNLTVRVRFSIAQDGAIGVVRLEKSSGDASFDGSVLRAVRTSSPLPPPPSAYRKEFSDYILEFVSGDLARGR